MTRLAAAGLTAVAITGGAALGVLSREVVPTDSTTTVMMDTVADNQYQGPCSVVTPPEPDPCEAAQIAIRYGMLGHLVNAGPFKTWKKGAPGDYARLNTILANPQCSTPSNPQPQIMVTYFGAAIADALEAYACAKGVGPVAWPVANPPPTAGATDKVAPTAPGPIIITP